MGACGGKFSHVYSELPEIAEHEDEFKALSFSEADIGSLYYLFRGIDEKRSNTIKAFDFLTSLELCVTPFSRELFSSFGDKSELQVNFREFVLTIWNFCTQTHSSLTAFAFDLYDKSSQGSIDKHELEKMLCDIYGDKFETNAYAKCVQYHITRLGKDVTFAIFEDFCDKRPLLLFPVFEFEEQLRSKILGESFWEMRSNKRMQLSTDAFKLIPMNDYMMQEMSTKAKERMRKKEIVSAFDDANNYYDELEQKCAQTFVDIRQRACHEKMKLEEGALALQKVCRGRQGRRKAKDAIKGKVNAYAERDDDTVNFRSKIVHKENIIENEMAAHRQVEFHQKATLEMHTQAKLELERKKLLEVKNERNELRVQEMKKLESDAPTKNPDKLLDHLKKKKTKKSTIVPEKA